MKKKYLSIVIVCWILELLILGYFFGAGTAFICMSILIPSLLFYAITKRQKQKKNQWLSGYAKQISNGKLGNALDGEYTWKNDGP